MGKNDFNQNNRNSRNNAISNENVELKRQEFIQIIRRKCSFNFDLEAMNIDKESGYATKQFKIFRKGDKPWIVQKGHLLTWSNEKFLIIQQMKQEGRIEKPAQEEGSFLDKIFSVFERVAADQGEKHFNKMFTKRFDIQRRNITGIGD